MAAADIVSRIRAIQGRMQAAAELAMAEAQEPIFQNSQGLVLVKTGRLKRTGTRHDPQTSGMVTTGVISYGSAETVTDFHGIGYEILVHTPGTKFYGGTPYLEQPTLDAKGSFAQTLAQSWRKALS